MNTLPTTCPICGGEITVTRIHCRDCDVTIEGRFVGGPFSQLSSEQLFFIETFVRCEGKINRMEGETNMERQRTAVENIQSHVKQVRDLQKAKKGYDATVAESKALRSEIGRFSEQGPKISEALSTKKKAAKSWLLYSS